jgi:hypothetical protein
MILSALLAICECAWFRDVRVADDTAFAFVEKFAFDTTGPGLMNITAMKCTNAGDVVMALYYDSNWLKIYDNDSLSCEQKVSAAWSSRTMNLTDLLANMIGKSSFGVEFKDYVRPHFWYVAVAACKSGAIKDFSIDLHFTQFQSGMYHEVSFDQQTLLPLYAFFTFVWAVLLVANVVGSAVLIRRAAFHPIVRICTFSIVLYTVALTCGLIYEAVYSSDGVGVPWIAGIGHFFDYVSDCVFLLLLILLAQGWAIHKQTIDHRNVILLASLVFLIAYITLMLVAQFAVNSAYPHFVFATIPGSIVMVLRSCLGVVFVIFCARTLRNNLPSDKRAFFRVLIVSYGLYIVLLPVLTVLSVLVFDYWYAYKVTFWLYSWVKLFGLGLMVILLSPMFADKYFSVSAPSLLGNRYESL